MLSIPPVPSDTDTVYTQIMAAVEQIHVRLRHLKTEYLSGKTGCWEVVQQTIFLKDYAWRDACQEMMRDFYKERVPVNIYVPQSPCDGQMVAIEAIIIFREEGMTSVEYHGEDMVISRHDGMSWYFCRQQDPDNPQEDVYTQSLASFQKLRENFLKEGVPFQNVIRIWIYLGNITEEVYHEKEGKTQRYKELNRARSDFFRGIPFFEGLLPEHYHGPKYPASTGIGGTGDCVVIGALGVMAEEPGKVQVVPLENPQQVPASAYGEEYSRKSPKFSRAMAVSVEGRGGERNGIIFVSGTASITDAESKYEGDPVLQTELTLENIRVLIHEENLAAHGMPGLGCELDQMAMIRVYIKHEQDYEIIKGVCDRLMPNVMKLFTFSDVCRPELLVEIEGMAFTQTRNSE